MNGCDKLGLGTAQWGMTYGIANAAGQPADAEIAQMLDLARRSDVHLLDTASSYGQAELRLGSNGTARLGFDLVTKTPPLKSNIVREENVTFVKNTFLTSLERLKAASVYGLLVHHADDLLVQHAERLWGLLQEMRERGTVRKIGVSVYDPSQLERVLERCDVDLVQLPFNIYDQRFAQSGMLRRLKERGIEVHTRSVFLQGLLLLAPHELPREFERLRARHAALRRLSSDAGLSIRDACLQFCLGHADIDKVIVGCETTKQLSEIFDSAAKRAEVSWAESCAVADESIINPSRWPVSVVSAPATHQACAY